MTITKILATSDTHFQFDSSKWPTCDVFIHAGDLMMSGEEKEWTGVSDCLKQVRAPVKYLIPGNHDRRIERFESLSQKELEDRGVNLVLPSSPVVYLPSGHSMFCLPYVTNLPQWSYSKTEKKIMDYLYGWWSWPDGPDIVVSHGPPYGILDKVPQEGSVGSKAAKSWWSLRRKKPKIWIFGHIHEGYGSEVVGDTAFYNVSHCDARYKKVNPPVEIEI